MKTISHITAGTEGDTPRKSEVG